MDKKNRIIELVEKLNKASELYYMNNTEYMTNRQYDKLYDELEELEKETGIILDNSPTQKVGAEISGTLPKVEHSHPMLSLNKTKSVEELEKFIGDKTGILSWKLDGLTIVLTYMDGKLYRAVTRGNGSVGEDVTNNAEMFRNLPKKIPFNGELVIRGEAVINYDNFLEINQNKLFIDIKNAVQKNIYSRSDNVIDIKNDIEDMLINDTWKLFSDDESFNLESLLYKNPRNLCSGAVRQLNPQITYERKVMFYAFALVKAENMDFKNSHLNELNFIENQGFEVVHHTRVTEKDIHDKVKWFSDNISKNNTASDGLVLEYDDIQYGKSLGSTSKFPLNAIAFKWEDNTVQTKLINVLWNPSRTGLINPIAIFEPVELEGTTVQRASLHNLGIFENLHLGSGDVITVYKANMIIPQIDENLTKSDTLEAPEYCPKCGTKLSIRENNSTRELYCPNDLCPAKINKFLEHFISKNGLDIKGIGSNILDIFIKYGYVRNYVDIFSLPERKNEIIRQFEIDKSSSERSTENKELKLGIKKLDNIFTAIEKAKSLKLHKLIAAIGISDIGKSVAKLIVERYKNDIDAIINADTQELQSIKGIGEKLAISFRKYFDNEENRKLFLELKDKLEIEDENKNVNDNIHKPLINLTFVITGKLNSFENRDALIKFIEDKGGKVSSSISSNTSYLINNDITSNSGKNLKAKKLGIPIISEEKFLNILG